MSSENAEFDTLKHRLKASMKLIDVTCRLAAQMDLDEILMTVTDSVRDAIESERATLYLFDDEKQELYTRVAIDLEISEIRTPIENGISGWVGRRRKIANIDDPYADARWNSAIDRKTGFHTRNILAAPVISAHDDRLLGVLQLLNKTEESFDEFDERLIQAFASHAAIAIERARLLDEARKSHELKISVEMGRGIQLGFLPSELPEIPGYEIAAWWQPAEAVGGDYYDLIQLPDGRLGLVVADVSGHGVGASLIMASVRAMLHVLTRTTSDPAKILSLLSETISPDLNEERFITFLMVALDPNAHEVVFANAGHGPALHFQRSVKEFRMLESTGLPMGFMTEFEIPQGQTVNLEAGDMLLLATDGVVELRNAQGELFGRERLEELVLLNAHLPAPQLLDVIRDTLLDFHPHEHPHDDVTLLILERKLT